MNFLAHLALSHFSPDLQVGNFIGDFIRGREVAELPVGIARGVHFHRAIDALTDRDPDVRVLNARLKKSHGRYAPVISDIGFDYYLYQNWEDLGPREFAAFKQSTYQNLLVAKPLLGKRVTRYLEAMVQGDWLALYTSREGMRRVFERLEPRLSRPELLSGVNDSLVNHAEAFNYAIRQLFPRLQALADAYRD